MTFTATDVNLQINGAVGRQGLDFCSNDVLKMHVSIILIHIDDGRLARRLFLAFLFMFFQLACAQAAGARVEDKAKQVWQLLD